MYMCVGKCTCLCPGVCVPVKERKFSSKLVAYINWCTIPPYLFATWLSPKPHSLIYGA